MHSGVSADTSWEHTGRALASPLLKRQLIYGDRDPRFPMLSLESKNQSRPGRSPGLSLSVDAAPLHPALLDGTIPDGHSVQRVPLR